MVRGTTKSPSPRVPVAAPSGRAVTRKSCASTTEQNHFSPSMRQLPSSLGVAMAELLPTSEPPWISVRN